jgi:hypothetical protein
MQPPVAGRQRLSDRQSASLERLIKGNGSGLPPAGCVFDCGVLDGQLERVQHNDIGGLIDSHHNDGAAVKDRAGQVGLEPQFVSDRSHVSRQAKGIVGSR